MKTCSKCKTEKSLDQFYKRADRDAYHSWCKQCKHESGKSWHERNKQRHSEINRKWYEENREQHLENNRKWARENSDKKQAAWAFRDRRSRDATPSWVNRKELKEFYTLALCFSKATGTKYEVDHIIPLINDLVCGLNVPDNLQVITAEENRRKSNKYDVTGSSVGQLN
jgi:hypothetical protein